MTLPAEQRANTPIKPYRVAERATLSKLILISTPDDLRSPASAAIIKEAFIKRGIEFRMNVFDGSKEWRIREWDDEKGWNGHWEWKEYRVDDHEGWLIIEIEEKCFYRAGKNGEIRKHLRLTKERLNNFIAHLCRNYRYDPVMDFMGDLDKQWDGKKRIETCLIDLFWAEDSEVNRYAGKAIWLGPVQRVFEPGCKLDEVIILKGVGGCGKTSFFREMPPNPDWYNGSISIRMSNKRFVEAMRSKLILEFSELKGMTQKDLDHIKAMITSQSDHIREAYRRDAKTIYRRCAFFGTTDKDDFLPHDPGNENRRFVVSELRRDPIKNGVKGGRLVENWMEKNRLQCWAEAVYMYKNGERANLPRDLKLPVALINKALVWKTDRVQEFIVSNMLREAMLAPVAHETRMQQGISLNSLCRLYEIFTGKNISYVDEQNISRDFANAGWDRKQRKQPFGRSNTFRVPEDWEFEIDTTEKPM